VHLLSLNAGLEMGEIGGANAVSECADDDVAVVGHRLAGGGVCHCEFQRSFRLCLGANGEGLDWTGRPVVQSDPVFESQSAVLLLEDLRVEVAFRLARLHD